MKAKKSIYLLIALLLVLFASCLNMKTVIKVKKDGSGEIEQVFLMSTSVMNYAASMTSTSMDSEDGNDEYTVEDDSDEEGISEKESVPDLTSQMADKEKLALHAKEMGEGVTLSSVTSVTEGDFSGYKAVYAFKDINMLKFNQNPGDLMPSDAVEGAGVETNAPKEYITFNFKKGALSVSMPEVEVASAEDVGDDDAVEEGAGEMDEATLNMMKAIYKDMKILLQIEVQGSITDTNASYRKGSTVTLMNIDFSKIIEDKKSFDALTKNNSETLEGLKGLVKNVKGIEIELQKKINIKFK
jgi:hypothetical protein